MAYTPPGQTRRKILEFMRRRLLAGRPPTVREVQRAFGFRSVQSARDHLEILVAQGHLAKEPGRARGYRLPPGQGLPTRRVPVVGRVRAGPFSEAMEDPEGYLEARLPGSSPERESGEWFALRVEGDSMSGAGILEGDVVIVRRQNTAQNGDLVVARVGAEATVKRFSRRRGRVELLPENPAYEPLSPPPDQLEILGRVTEVRRYIGREPPLIPPDPPEDTP